MVMASQLQDTLAPLDYAQGGALQPKPATSTSGSGKKAKQGVNQLQLDLIKNLFGNISPFLNNVFQSNFQSNVSPSLFNFDPSKAYANLPGMNAAKAQFNPNDYFGALPSAQAAMINYDPNSWLNKYNAQVNPTLSNFNPNNFMSQLTGDYIAGIGSDANELTRIRNDMRNIQGLPQLDASTLGQLNAITQANTGQINQQFGTAKEQLLNDLFGRGLNASTVALDQGGKLLYGRDQLTQQELANAANRQLGLQQNIRDFNLGNLVQQAGTVRDQFSAKAQQAGLSQQGDLARMQSGLQNSLANAGFANEANQFNAQALLQKVLAGNQTASQIASQNAGFQQQANLQNSQLGTERGNLAAQLMQQIALQNAGFEQQANQFNAQSALDVANNINNFSTQIGLANAGFQNQADQFNTSTNASINQANLNALLQQFGLRSDLFNNQTSQFFGRKQDNKKINFDYAQLEQQRQQFQQQLALQYAQLQAQINAQKGGFFKGLLGKIIPTAASAFLPGIGSAIAPLLGGLGSTSIF